MPMEFDGQRMYVYCANNGVVGVSAKDGSILWETTDWKISIATVPSPLILSDGRIFLTGGYNAGSLMLQLRKEGERLVPRTVFKLEPGVFGATQHTPILYDNHLYGVRADGKFVCLTLDGKPVWTSGSGQQFGLGSFIMADGLILRHERLGPLAPHRGDAGKIHPARAGAGIERPRVVGAAGAGGGQADRPRPHPHGLPGCCAALSAPEDFGTIQMQGDPLGYPAARSVRASMFGLRRIRPIKAQNLDVALIVAA